MSDLLPSLKGHPLPARLTGSQFIHPSLPAAGRGPDVEGLTSGRPDPRPALRTMNNAIPLYKYFPTRLPCCTFEKVGISSNNILKRVTLIVPNAPFLINPKTFPPLGVLCLAAFLRERGIEVEVLDLAGLDEKEQRRRVDEIEGEVVGISCVTPTYHEALKIKRWLEEAGKIIVIGGPHATTMPHTCLDDGFYAVVRGDGEYAFYEFLKKQEPGIYSRYLTEEELGKLPLPARDLIDIHSYRYFLDGKKTTSMITAIGCPYRCRFCSLINKKVRFFPVKRVKSEIMQIKNMGFSGLMIYDDIFTLRYPRFKEITDFIKENDMVYRCFTHVRLVEKYVEQLARTGCVEVGIGIESGSDKILKIVNKGFTAEEALRAVKLLKEHGIKVKTFIIVGLPSESYETINETREWLRQAEPDDVDISLFSPLPGSEIFENPQAYDISFQLNYDKSWFKGQPGSYQTTVSTSHLSSEELLRLREELEKEFKPREKLR